MTLGDVSVDGFFLLSGFLIVKSWERTPSLSSFLRNRILRIVPGYLVAALLSTIVVGVLAPGIPHFFRHFTAMFPLSLLVLRIPSTPPVFPGLPDPSVNGSMWTIAYEFRCYLLVALFGLCGLFRKPVIWGAITILLLLGTFFVRSESTVHWHQLYLVVGYPPISLRLTAVYFVGGCFFLYRRHIVFLPKIALAIGACALPLLFVPRATETAVVLAGGYLMFYLGKIHLKTVAGYQSFPDISYGIYLYGWPVESLLTWYFHWNPYLTFLISAMICFCIGWLSWHFVEYPMLTLKRDSTAPLPPST